MLKCCIGAFSWILLYLSLASFNKISCSHTVVPIVIIFLPSWFLMVKYQPTSFVKNLMRLFIELPIVAQWISFLPPWRKKKYFTIRHHQSVFTNANHDHAAEELKALEAKLLEVKQTINRLDQENDIQHMHPERLETMFQELADAPWWCHCLLLLCLD